MCNFRCPLAEKRKCANFLLCRALEKDGEDYNVRSNALGVICPHQELCMRTGQMENIDPARSCYAAKREEIARTKVLMQEPVAEAAPEPKKNRRKKAE